MTEAEKKKREKYDREAAILAHSIAAQVAAAEDITYYGAFHILDHAKAILENEMKRQRAKAPAEVRDRWGDVIETPRQEDRGEETV